MLRFAEDEASLFRHFNDATVVCDMPNKNLYKFQGTLTMADGAVHPLGADQVLLKGSILRNTGYIYGIAVYTGHQTKVMENSLKARVKKSKVELQTNWYIIIIVAIQMTVCITSALANMLLTKSNSETLVYIYGPNFNESMAKVFFVSFFQWFILL